MGGEKSHSVIPGRRVLPPPARALQGGGLGWGSADLRFLPPATPSPTLPLQGEGAGGGVRNDYRPNSLRRTPA